MMSNDLHKHCTSMWPSYLSLSPARQGTSPPKHLSFDNCVRVAIETLTPFVPTDPIAAILVMRDCENRGRDIQKICDLMHTNGTAPFSQETAPVLNPFPSATLSNHEIQLMFSNEDFVWAYDYPLVLLRQHAFKFGVCALPADWSEIEISL